MTEDPDVALAAFAALVNRPQLDGEKLLAVLNKDGRPVAHHNYQLRPDGSPHNPMNYWRGRLNEIDWSLG